MSSDTPLWAHYAFVIDSQTVSRFIVLTVKFYPTSRRANAPPARPARPAWPMHLRTHAPWHPRTSAPARHFHFQGRDHCYVNGELRANMSRTDFVGSDYAMGVGGVLTIGQEQDTLAGGFDQVTKQAIYNVIHTGAPVNTSAYLSTAAGLSRNSTVIFNTVTFQLN